MTFRDRVKQSLAHPLSWIVLSFWAVIFVIGLAKSGSFWMIKPTEYGVMFAYTVAAVALVLAGGSFAISCQPDHPSTVFSGNEYFSLGLLLAGISLYYLSFALFT